MMGSRSKRHRTHKLLALTGLLICVSLARAAEVRGTVVVDYQGLFEVDKSVQNHPISVALIPDEGQSVVRRGVRTEHIEIVENRMHPSFLTVQKGDSVSFVNRDAVFHQLFSLSPGEPLSVQLAKAGSGSQSATSIKLDQAGVTHFFCRIHNKSYARIDVVETPYLQTIQPGQSFHFVGIAQGRWQLRVSSPAAETLLIPVTALTAPQPLQITLASRGGGMGSGKLKAQSGVDQLYRN